jgi:GNAT superfamily N-acetyltransferase
MDEMRTAGGSVGVPSETESPQKKRDRATPEKVLIRPFKAADRERVREIFCWVGQRGNPLHVYIEDEGLVLPFLADYFMDEEPEWCLVTEADGKVVGYILGCKDTKRYMRVVLTRILPRLILRAFWKIITFQYRKKQTYRTIWWAIARSWRELPSAPVDQYPASCHLGLEAGYQHLGLGGKLVDAFFDRVRANGLPGAHGIIIEEVGKNVLAQALGTEVREVRRTTLWDKCTDKRWEFKLIVRDK